MIRVRDHVNQCYSNADGDIIQAILRGFFSRNEKVVVSFEGIDSASTSFINSAFIELLQDYDFNFIKQNLIFVDSIRTINELIKKRFTFEVNERKKLLNV